LSAPLQLPDATRRAADAGALRRDGVSRPVSVTAHRRSVAVWISTALAVAALLGSRISYVPMWDGFIYASAINHAVQRPLAFASLRLGGHASHAYGVMAVAAQALSPGSYWPTLLLGAALLSIAAIAFHRLARLAFPAQDQHVDVALLTAAFALQPTLLASVVQPGLDLAIVPAFLWCVVLLLENRRIALVAVGIVLAFTKETGVLLYAALLVTYAVWTFARTPGTARDKILSVIALAPLSTPGVVFGAYLLIRTRLIPAGEVVVWNAGTAMIGQSLVRQLLVPRIDRYVASYLVIVFILNFSWVTTLTVGTATVVAARRAGTRRIVGEAMRFAWTRVGFVSFLTLVATFALTRFASYANSRYLLPVIALSLVPFLAALQALQLRAASRRALLAATCVLVFVSNVRTIDPISRAVFGTFAFGDHRLLRMTSITHECCGSGRDQLVYSLEFTNIERLTSDALAALSPGDTTLIVLPDSTNWFAVGLLDRTTNRRTLDSTRAIAPGVVEADSAHLFMDRYQRAEYLALPNGFPDRGLALLSRHFLVGRERRFTRNGYALSTYRLALRPR
jgi:hypothetical protein